MSGRIFKYKISNDTSMQTTTPMREGALIRAVGMQDNAVHVWAEVPYDVGGERLVPRTFLVVPTGGDIPDPGNYVGTVFEGPFVWHVYEVTTAAGRP